MSFIKNIFQSKQKSSKKSSLESHIQYPSVYTSSSANPKVHRSILKSRSVYDASELAASRNALSLAGDTEFMGPQIIKRSRSRARSLVSSDSSEVDNLNWQDRMVTLEYENKKLLLKLDRVEAKCDYLSDAKRQIEKAFLREINDVKEHNSILRTEKIALEQMVMALETRLDELLQISARRADMSALSRAETRSEVTMPGMDD
ncbi:unnamed protein product [Auanema sp. JU1783]|nr:unnamed protein product [Auanema sp. JU1783]